MWQIITSRSFWNLDALFLLCVSGLSVVFIVVGQSMKKLTALFPVLVGFVTLGLALFNLCMLAIRTYRESLAQTPATVGEKKVSEAIEGVHWFSFATAFVIYVLATMLLGFVVATLIFCALTAVWLGIRSYGLAVLFSILSTVSLTLLFGKVFLIRFPQGILWQLILGG